MKKKINIPYKLIPVYNVLIIYINLIVTKVMAETGPTIKLFRVESAHNTP